MVAQLVVGVPLAYVMAFKAGRFELPLLLGLVVLDGLNPVVRIYAWRMLLGRNGIINGSLEWAGIIDKPIDALLFNNSAVIVVLSTSWITYTVIPIYASMKAIDANLFQAAADLGAGWWTILRRILLPLAAPGIFVAILLVYIPLFTDFATPTMVGGTSGYMLGQAVNDLILARGDLASGAALSFILLVCSGDRGGARLPAVADQPPGVLTPAGYRRWRSRARPPIERAGSPLDVEQPLVHELLDARAGPARVRTRSAWCRRTAGRPLAGGRVDVGHADLEAGGDLDGALLVGAPDGPAEAVVDGVRELDGVLVARRPCRPPRPARTAPRGRPASPG